MFNQSRQGRKSCSTPELPWEQSLAVSWCLRLMKMSICWMACALLAVHFATLGEIGVKPVTKAIMRNCPNYADWSNHI